MQFQLPGSFLGQKDRFLLLPACLRRGLCLAAIMAGMASTALGADRSSALDVARQLNQAFAEVAEKVSPVVVVIEVAQNTDPHRMLDPDSEYWDALPPQFKELFKEELEKELEKRKSGEAEEEDDEPSFNGRGSGIVIRKDGYILTNSHVVQNAEKIRVRFNNGREYPAEIRGVDELSDVAVIKIEARGLPTAKLGNSTAVKVGEFAIAIGAPFDLDYSITYGHVSGKGRSGVIPGIMGGNSMDQDFIQTDASINPGNSGGPLVNIDGEVIGINTMIKGPNTGIGFAIPSNLAREVADHLISEGRYTRAWLGIGLAQIKDSRMRNRLSDLYEGGVVVESIRPDGPASRSKLAPADVITAVDGKPIRTVQELRHAVRSYKIGSSITLSVNRDGKTVPIKVTTSEWNMGQSVMAKKDTAPPIEKASQKKAKMELGLQVEVLTKETAKSYGLEGLEGVVVTEVSPKGMGAKAGILRGHIITAVERKPVKTESEFLTAIESAKTDEILIFLSSRGAPEYRVLKKN